MPLLKQPHDCGECPTLWSGTFNLSKWYNTNVKYDVIVIGAGASGMMAAGRAAETGANVLLLEKNAVVGKKLSITGVGRCNITNNTPEPKEFL